MKITGTERGHFYEVVGCGERGLVGVREIDNDLFRVRIQGWPKEGGALPEGFEVKSDYHTSRIAASRELATVVRDALDYVTS